MALSFSNGGVAYLILYLFFVIRIFREEGLFTLWRGAIPTMGRAMVVNAAQLASYSQAKQFILPCLLYNEHKITSTMFTWCTQTQRIYIPQLISVSCLNQAFAKTTLLYIYESFCIYELIQPVVKNKYNRRFLQATLFL